MAMVSRSVKSGSPVCSGIRGNEADHLNATLIYSQALTSTGQVAVTICQGHLPISGLAEVPWLLLLTDLIL